MSSDIVLTESLHSIKRTLLERCGRIEETMARAIDLADWSQIEEKLNDLLIILPTCAKMMQDATLFYDTAKGLVTELILEDPKLLDLKQAPMLRFYEGKLAECNSIYQRVERCCKDLVNSMEGYRSLLSFEKEQLRNMLYKPQGEQQKS